MIKNYLDYLSLASKAAEYHRAYHEGETPLVTDYEYDQLRKELIKWETDNPSQVLDISPTFKVGATRDKNKKNELKHDTRMLSIENVMNEEELKSWVSLWKTKSGEDVSIVGEFKYDGIALSLRYIDGVLTRGLTRGDGEYGEDVTKAVSLFVPTTITTTGVVEIRGEAVLKNDFFELINRGQEKYANARSAVVGLLNPSRKELHYHTHHITFIPYDIQGPDYYFIEYLDKLETLKQLGFYLPNCFTPPIDKIKEVFETIDIIRSKGDVPFDIDGMVFKVNSIKHQKDLGETSHSPSWMFAYKFPPIKGMCTLLNVVFQVGRSGEVAPVAKVTATTLMGVTITSVLLHNEERMRERKISIGNVYEIYRSGDVIPHLGKLITEVKGVTPVEFPECCPSCGSPLIKRGAIYYCVASHTCPSQKAAAISYAVSNEALSIDGLAEQTVKLMLEKSLIRTTADIFELKMSDIATLPGYTDFSASKLWFNILLAKKTTLDRYILALGISEVGKSTARKLARRVFKKEALLDLTTPETVLALGVADIGEKTATNMAAYFSDPQLRANAERLMEHLEIENNGDVNIIEGVVGKTFVFTGSFKESKESMENKVLAGGGFVGGNVSSNTDYLVVGSRPGSKLKRAALLDTDVIDERVFLSLFEQNEKPTINKTTIGDFQQLPNGLYVGYHVEGCETFELAGKVPLSMETLHDNRPLFLSHSDSFWFPNHLPEVDFSLYEIQFSLPKKLTYSSDKEYAKVCPVFIEKDKGYSYSAELNKLIKQGYHMFSLEENNKEGESPESFIINPTQYVKSIKKVSRVSKF